MGVQARPSTHPGRTISIATTALILLLGSAAPASAQEVTQLTLADAIRLATSNNPTYLSTSNDKSSASWGIRAAYADFLPSFTMGGGLRYDAPGTQSFGIFTAEDIGAGNTDYLFSDYFMRLDYSLSGAKFFRAASAHADSKAVDARVRFAAFTLSNLVTQQYMTTLRAQEAVEVTEGQLLRATENFELASARVQAGTAVSTDSKQAEVDRGRAEVALLQAQNDLRTEKLRLREQIGVDVQGEIDLASEFEVIEPSWTLEELMSYSTGEHPSIAAFEASENAAVQRTRESKSSYFPTITASAAWSGFARQIGDNDFLLAQARDGVNGSRNNCMLFNQISAGLTSPLEGYPRDCTAITLTPEDEQRILQRNKVFPFDFTPSPLSLSLRVTVPVFQGLQRKLTAERAEVVAEDARYARRAEELRIKTLISTTFSDVQTRYRIVQIEERNRDVAGQQLELARERYRLGAANFFELVDAQSSMATAERDHVNAVYDYHDSLAALEEAVGQRLRPEEP